jgi:hypothetical protein
MHATFRQQHASPPGTPIQGTFYPSSGPTAGGSVGAILPKVLAVIVTMAVVRALLGASRRHGGRSRWSRRREAIAELHRELHAQEAAADSV